MVRFPSPGPRLRVDWRDGVERLRVVPRRNWKAVGTAFAALLFGSFKLELGLDHFAAGRDWWDYLAAAGIFAAWIGWAVASLCEFFGSESFSVERRIPAAGKASGSAGPELVIRRGIGPVKRSWRYGVRDISELVSPFAEEDAKPTVHNIFFRPKKGGAVRFEVGSKEIYFAETLDEEGGAAVVEWLSRRFPRSAREMW